MAPASIIHAVAKRYVCYSGDDNCYDDYNSTWDNWGRWVALVAIVVAILLLAFLFSIINSRRRRRRGVAPMYGTGWMGGNKYSGGTNNQGYYANQPHNGAAAPPYSPPVGNQYTGTTFNSNDGYYGNHGAPQPGIELQEPQSSYHPQRGGDPVYTAPMGPPPAKGDGIIR